MISYFDLHQITYEKQMSQNIFSVFPQKIFYIKRNDNKWTIIIEHGPHDRMSPNANSTTRVHELLARYMTLRHAASKSSQVYEVLRGFV